MKRAMIPGVVSLVMSSLSCGGSTSGALMPESAPVAAAGGGAPGAPRATPPPEDS